ncbi:GAF and ANTAR domain-containing protein [Streptomyces monomycini]|uniref:GAF and ANTAR domain-containing protein n=1 Tax=Streptomyces monomycini TaxID=371720 RepID=UPI0004AB972A|nr:GAF and ANTAR domain-containing protein [Streptomyces monomycini]
MSASDREEALLAALLELADPAAGRDTTALVERLAEFCVGLPGVQAGGVLMARDRQPALAVGFGAGAARLERVEVALDEGPCRDAWRTGRRLTDVPLGHPDYRARWPRFTTQALDRGFSAATALPVRYRNRRLGSLNFFHQYRALSRREIATGQALADAVAIGLAYRKDVRELKALAGQLQTALDSRVLIEQAKGALAERQDRTPDDAFRVMRSYARSHQRKLTEVARQVIGGPAASGPFARSVPR